MESTNVLIDSYLQIIQAEFFHEIALMYEKHSEILGEKFEPLMKNLFKTVDGLRQESKPGTTFMEAAIVLTLYSDDDCSEEENRHTNELIKACIEWKRRKDSAQLKSSFVPCSEN